ncbi:glutathione S-transferase [Phaeobacter sp. C3_T13_0]|uniref:glutathione S-transferase n=1 Tax=Phaeobacter cretensis TaxID=3342641 RepID=UPI0039BCFC3C
MQLHWSPRSPFVRKVMIVLHETGQLDQVELIRTLVALHLKPQEDVLAATPLGKIPALVTDQGQTLFDSRVISEYLDTRAGTGIFPSDPTPRFKHLRWQALGDGLTDILLLWRTELSRETGPWLAVTEGWLAKVRACLHQFETEAEALSKAPFGIGQIAVICGLGQLDFRWPDCEWRTHFPKLAQLERELSTRPSIAATAITDDQTSGENDVTVGGLTF